MLRALSVSAGNLRGPLYMDQVLAALHQGNPHRLPVALAVTRYAGEVTLCCRVPPPLQGLLEGQIYAQYPDAKIRPLPEDFLDATRVRGTFTGELHMLHDLFPIKRYAQFEDALNRQSADPVSAILSAIAGDESAAVEIALWPAGRSCIGRARRCLRRLASPFFRSHHRLATLYLILASSSLWILRVPGWILGRLASHGGAAELRPLDTSGSRQHDREEDLQAASDKAGKLLFEVSIRLRVTCTDAKDAKRRLREIAAAFGQFNSRHRRRHCMCVGKTGTGKTTLLRHLVQSDIVEGRGVCLMDPHGDLAEAGVRARTPEASRQAAATPDELMLPGTG